MKTHGMRVTLAENGQEAISLLEADTFDGVLMDCMMPVMDGYEATRHIRQQDRFKALPILALTADAVQGAREKTLQAGMNDYIGKPINNEQMFQTLAKWIKVGSGVIKRSDKAGEVQPWQFPETLSGIDVEVGLMSTAQNRELYQRLLNRFVENQASFEDDFRNAFDTGDLDTCTRLAHTLKSVSGSLGALELYQESQVLEQSCKESEKDIRLIFNGVVNELHHVFGSIKSMRPSDKQVVPSPYDQLTLKELLEQLSDLIHQSNSEAVDLIKPLEALISNKHQSLSIGELVSALKCFDFDKADIELKKIPKDLF